MVKEERTDRTKLRDEISSFAGIIWNRQAADRDEWRMLGEAFGLQWTQADDDDY